MTLRKAIKKKFADDDYNPPKPRKRTKKQSQISHQLSQSPSLSAFLLELYPWDQKAHLRVKKYTKERVEEAERLVKNHEGNISQKKFQQYFGVQKSLLMRIYRTKEIDQLKKNAERKIIRLLSEVSGLRLEWKENRNQTWTKKFFHKHECCFPVWSKIWDLPAFLEAYLERTLPRNQFVGLTVTEKDQCIQFQTYILVQIKKYLQKIVYNGENIFHQELCLSKKVEMQQMKKVGQMQEKFNPGNLTEEDKKSTGEESHHENSFICPCCQDDRPGSCQSI